MAGTSSSQQQVESSLHFQGAVAVEGEAMLWKPSAQRSSWPQARRSKDPFRDPFPEPWRPDEEGAPDESDQGARPRVRMSYMYIWHSNGKTSSALGAGDGVFGWVRVVNRKRRTDYFRTEYYLRIDITTSTTSKCNVSISSHQELERIR